MATVNDVILDGKAADYAVAADRGIPVKVNAGRVRLLGVGNGVPADNCVIAAGIGQVDTVAPLRTVGRSPRDCISLDQRIVEFRKIKPFMAGVRAGIAPDGNPFVRVLTGHGCFRTGVVRGDAAVKAGDYESLNHDVMNALKIAVSFEANPGVPVTFGTSAADRRINHYIRTVRLEGNWVSLGAGSIDLKTSIIAVENNHAVGGDGHVMRGLNRRVFLSGSDATDIRGGAIGGGQSRRDQRGQEKCQDNGRGRLPCLPDIGSPNKP